MTDFIQLLKEPSIQVLLILGVVHIVMFVILKVLDAKALYKETERDIRRNTGEIVK